MIITDWSLDIETMGVGQRAALCQIGLVSFNRNSGKIFTKSLFDIDLEDSIRLGGRVHINTVKWWATQKNGFHYQGKVYSVKEALTLLSQAIISYEPIPIWAKGPTFDLSILERHYNKVKLQVPWRYNMPRDLRTLIDVAGSPAPQYEITHNALQDAVDQAAAICMLLQRLKR